jgi:hypothetical protein
MYLCITLALSVQAKDVGRTEALTVPVSVLRKNLLMLQRKVLSYSLFTGKNYHTVYSIFCSPLDACTEVVTYGVLLFQEGRN